MVSNAGEPVSTPVHVDILGIGFGPANLSLAIAIEEHNATARPDDRLTARFVEAQQTFGWHDGMLLPHASMQISFLKDLVSLRAPTSPYTFLNYLHERDRLSDFINLKTFFPARREFFDYLSWAAERVSVAVDFGTRAVRIDRAGQRFCVTVHRDSGDDGASGGGPEQVDAGAIVLGTGICPTLPDGITAGPRVFHNHRLLSDLETIPDRPHDRFLVVGAGQSAAEVTAYLHELFPTAEVHTSIRRFGYLPSDDTPYANRIFDPDSVDEFYSAPAELRTWLLSQHWSTNYSAVDAGLINDLYRREYDEKVRGQRRLVVHRMTEVADLREDPGGVEVTLRDIGDRGTIVLKVDAVVFATGFRSADPGDLLGAGFETDQVCDAAGPVVARDYSLEAPGADGRIFLNGAGVQNSHGLTSSLLSNVAVRSAEILSAVIAKTTPPIGEEGERHGEESI